MLLVCCVLGCGEKVPQFSASEQTLLKRLQDQIGKHNVAASKQLCDQVEDLHKRGKLTEEQYGALHRVCGSVVDQRWDEANERISALIAAQGKGK